MVAIPLCMKKSPVPPTTDISLLFTKIGSAPMKLMVPWCSVLLRANIYMPCALPTGGE
ncbi:hypothetical protein NC652_009135 [Populus alba x Populus x berolinensis]|nr:hypothetical protein NC652_009135 [Populus alba x Populus x berolinensis]